MTKMTNFLSIIFYFVCVFLWDTVQRNHFVVSGTDVNSVRVIKNVTSNFPPVSLQEDTDINTKAYKFLNTHFEEKLYAFQSHKEEDEKIHIIVWESSDKGENWEEKKKLPCEFSNDSCEVMSSMVVNKELIVIYGNETEYSIAKYRNNSPGSEWEILKGTNEDLTRGEAIYYSGNSFEINIREESPYILCYNLKVLKDRRNYDDTLSTAVAACSFSYTEGKSWEETYYIYVRKNLDFVKMSKLLFLEKNSFALNVITKSPKSSFARCVLYENDINCDKFFPLDSNILNSVSSDDLNSFIDMYNIPNEATAFIYKREKAYVLSVLFKGQNHFANDILLLHDISSKDVVFHVILSSELTFSIMYEENKKMQVLYVDLTKKKAGCEFLSDGKKLTDVQPSLGLVHYNKNYSSRFLLNSEGVQECYLNHNDIASVVSQRIIQKEGLFKGFSVIVPENVDFRNSRECFVYSFFKNSSNSSQSVNSNLGPYATKIIKLRQVINKKIGDRANEKEYYFYFPSSFNNYFSDVDRVTCYSTDNKYAIHYTFENNKYLILALINRPIERLQGSKKKFTILNSDNEYWHYYKSQIPKGGSYVINMENYLKNYKDSTAITAKGHQLIDQLVNENVDVKKHSIVTFPLQDNFYSFEGVDLTDTSPYYKMRVGDIDEDKEFHIDVTVLSSGTTTVGLVCPLHQETPSIFCFDFVYNDNNKVVRIEKVHNNIPFFVIPKRQIYGEQNLIESLIEYNDASYRQLVNNDTTLSFFCKCKVNSHLVTVHYKIKGEPKELIPLEDETPKKNAEGERQPSVSLNDETLRENPEEEIQQSISSDDKTLRENPEGEIQQPFSGEGTQINSGENNSGSASLQTKDINNTDSKDKGFGIHHIFCSFISLFFFMFYTVFI